MTCGEGVRNNTRIQKIAAQFGGDECDGFTSAIETCKEKECPGMIYPKIVPNLVSYACNVALDYVIEFYLFFQSSILQFIVYGMIGR